jgi:hypothetical protein
MFSPYAYVLRVTCVYVRAKAWLAARVSLRLARMPHPARARRSSCLHATLVAAPVLFAHAFGIRHNMEKTYGIRSRLKADKLAGHAPHNNTPIFLAGSASTDDARGRGCRPRDAMACAAAVNAAGGGGGVTVTADHKCDCRVPFLCSVAKHESQK